MKGLILRLIGAGALLLWALDMVYPWQKLMLEESNRYTQIQKQKYITVGTINHPLAYFVNAEGEAGIEYELAKAFADYLGVNLRMKTFDNSEQLFNALKENKVDLIASGLLYQPERGEQFQIGASYYSASWQVAYKKGTTRPYNLNELKHELVIPAGSAVIPILERLKETNPNLKWQTTDKFTQEELLLQVADGKIPHTVSMSVDLSSAQHIRPNVAVAFDLTDESPVVWYLPNSSFSELQASVIDFMDKANETGLLARIEEKYFNYLARFDYVDTQTYLNAIKNTLPKYQHLFEKYRGHLEWQMLAAIAYQESHWDPSATSPTGVRGMMMLTRDTAERMKVTDRTDTEQSIKGGSEYLHLLMEQIPATVPKEDRIWYGLAAYNMGFGHLLDVRRLTKQLGGDPDNWLDVKKNLPLLAEKRYYKGLKYGYARGFEAFSYVENIRRYYNSIINHQRVEAKQQKSKTATLQLAKLEEEKRQQEAAEQATKLEEEKRQQEATEQVAKLEEEKRQQEATEQAAKLEEEKRQQEATEQAAKLEAEKRQQEVAEQAAKLEAEKRQQEATEQAAKLEEEKRQQEAAEQAAKLEEEKRQQEAAEQAAKLEEEKRQQEATEQAAKLEEEKRQQEAAEQAAKLEEEKRRQKAEQAAKLEERKRKEAALKAAKLKEEKRKEEARKVAKRKEEEKQKAEAQKAVKQKEVQLKAEKTKKENTKKEKNKPEKATSEKRQEKVSDKKPSDASKVKTPPKTQSKTPSKTQPKTQKKTTQSEAKK